MNGAEAIPIIKRRKQAHDRSKHPIIGQMETSYISTAYSEIIRELTRNKSSDVFVTLEKLSKRMDSAACELTFSSRYCGHLCAVVRDVTLDTYDILQKIAVEGSKNDNKAID